MTAIMVDPTPGYQAPGYGPLRDGGKAPAREASGGNLPSTMTPIIEKQQPALQLVRDLMALPFAWAIENPIGCISTRIRKADQIIHPHQFGDDASKATCLWLKDLPKLTATGHVPPRIVNGRKRWANQTDSGQNKLPPSADRWKLRSKTYPGIAAAMAMQWGGWCIA